LQSGQEKGEDEMTVNQNLIVIQMACDIRVPREAIGYIADLHGNPSATVMGDRLQMLQRYVPDLVAKFLEAEKEGGR